jgi:hypothetical protein
VIKLSQTTMLSGWKMQAFFTTAYWFKNWNGRPLHSNGCLLGTNRLTKHFIIVCTAPTHPAMLHPNICTSLKWLFQPLEISVRIPKTFKLLGWRPFIGSVIRLRSIEQGISPKTVQWLRPELTKALSASLNSAISIPSPCSRAAWVGVSRSNGVTMAFLVAISLEKPAIGRI